jgi:hypothetical protein
MHLSPSHQADRRPGHLSGGSNVSKGSGRFVRLLHGESPCEAEARHRLATGFRGIVVVLA